MKGIRQHDNKDCGVACLATILRQYKSFVPMVKIREFMHVDKNGASMFALCKTAEHFGMTAVGFEGSFEELKDEAMNHGIRLPLIAHVITDEKLSHYIVVKKISNTHVFVFDPAKGHRKYKDHEFKELFTDFFMEVFPSCNFKAVPRTLRQYGKFMDIILNQKKLFSSALLLSVAIAGFSIFSSFAYQTMIDKYILGNDQAIDLKDIPVFSDLYLYVEELCGSLSQLFIAILVIYLLQNLLFALRGIIITNIYKNSSRKLISDYCRALLKLPMPFFHDRETGEILSRYNDIEELQSVISGIGLSVIMDVVMAIAGGTVLFVISFELFKIVMVMTAIYALIVFLYRRPIGNISRSIMESDSMLMSKIKESVDGIETIKTTCSEDNARMNMQERVEEYVGEIKKGSMISLSQSVIMSLSQGMGNLAILYFGCKFILEGTISLGTFISFETLIYFFISPIQNLLSMQLALQQAFAAADRLNDVFENDMEEDLFKGKDEYESHGQTRLEVSDLSFAYGYGDPVLKSVSFTAVESEKIAVVGKSGCGKTTLFHIIGLLEKEYDGRILINDKDIEEMDKTEYRKNVIYVPQESAFFADTFRANVMLGKDMEEERLRIILKGCELEDLISGQRRGLDFVLEENGKNLSGGQKQRMAIARALVRNPKILLLDESTSHLDEETEEKIFRFISDEFRDTICFFSTHRESLIGLCDRNLHILDGQIAGR